MTGHTWFYRCEDLIGNVDTLGPIDESELVRFANDGKIKRAGVVASPSRTSGKWFPVKQVPSLLQAIEAGESVRAEEKRQRAAAEAAAQDSRRAQEHALRERERLEFAAISHCQNIDLVKSLREKIAPLLTSQESIVYIAVQQKPVVNITPDAIVATSRRLIFYRAKLLGRFEFQDYAWFDIFNAHIQQNLLGAVFTCQHVSGAMLSMDYLPKESAQALYRLAQESEERARLARHQLHLDTLRAGATNISVGQTGSAPPNTMQSSPIFQGNDLVKRLETLKSMFDKGLITADDFERRKQEILSQI